MKTPGQFSTAINTQSRLNATAFVFSRAGSAAFRAGRTVSLATAGKAIAINIAAVDRVDISPGHDSSAVIIHRSLLTERLALLLGRPIADPPLFEPVIDQNSGQIAAIESLAALATTREFGLDLNQAKLTAMRLRDMLIDIVLETWPNTYSESLRRPPPMIAPRNVKLVIDFINEHPLANPSGAELANLTGASLRSLQAGFQRFVGSSITAYQRQIRLDRAREELIRNPSASIEEIALRWGFTNAGRFSRYFKAGFGVSPAKMANRRR
ncbi:helix-turn-helix domain-containing protein [Sphingobium yanoikuyae]|uniref:helix-turn-helix domain-containing protein n=1 Tax=Sphingobium yanoikuyae TaxID=13690 RepID=UPI0035C685D1